MNKKGYFFIVDGLIAVVVLISGLVIIGSVFASSPVFKPPYNIGQDLFNALSKTNISTYDNPNHAPIETMFNNGKIIDGSASVLEQVGIFYDEYCNSGDPTKLADARDMLSEVVPSLIPNPYKYELRMDGSICTTKSMHNTGLLSNQQTSKTLLSTERIVFGTKDYTTLFGPYTATIIVWA